MTNHRILHIFYELKYSGAEIMYSNAAPIFIANGCKLYAFSTGPNLGEFSIVLEKSGFMVYHKPFTKKIISLIFFWIYFFNLYQFIKKENIDVLHIHREQFYWLYALVGFLSGVKVIKTIHSCFIPNSKYLRIKNYIERFLTTKLFNTTFTAISDTVYETEVKYYNNYPKIIYNWIDNRFFPLNAESEKITLRQKLGIPEKSFVIISVGSCIALKRHKDIIEAVNILSKKNIDITYLHLGSGPLCEEEYSLAANYNVEKNVIFTGAVNNVRDYLVASDVFIMSSDYEGFSLATVEAMACKIPVILYNSVGLSDLIHENNNGFLIEKTPEEIAKHVEYYFNSNDLRKDKAQIAYQFVIQKFSMAKSVQEFLTLYNQVLIDTK